MLHILIFFPIKYILFIINIMADIDTNVSNYTLSELLSIVGLDDNNVNEATIKQKTNILINKFKYKNPQISVFFKERRLVQKINVVKNVQLKVIFDSKK